MEKHLESSKHQSMHQPHLQQGYAHQKLDDWARPISRQPTDFQYRWRPSKYIKFVFCLISYSSFSFLRIFKSSRWRDFSQLCQRYWWPLTKVMILLTLGWSATYGASYLFSPKNTAYTTTESSDYSQSIPIKAKLIHKTIEIYLNIVNINRLTLYKYFSYFYLKS